MTPNPATYNDGDDAGSITLVATVTGLPSGGSELEGTVGATDITLIFQATVTAGSLESLGIGVVDTSPFGGVNSTASGWIPGADVDVSLGAGSTAGTRIFDFDGGQLDAGETSDLFFVSYASLEGDGTQEVIFMVNPSSGSDFNITPRPELVVPEPAHLALLGLGLAALALSWRRWDR